MSAYFASSRPQFYSASLTRVAQKTHRWPMRDTVEREVTTRRVEPRGMLPLSERRKRACLR